MHALRTTALLPVYLFASPVYWPDAAERTATAGRLERALRAAWPGIVPDTLAFHLIASDDDLAAVLATDAGGVAVFVPMSGGTQPWMLRLADRYAHVALVHAYLPGALADELPDVLLHRNAHPACTDFFAHRRLAGHPATWMRAPADVVPLWRAWQAVHRLRSARLLKIGETEPWVVNSCRSPERFRDQLGLDVVPLPLGTLYDEVARVDPEDATDRAQAWIDGATALVGIEPGDVADACTVVLAMERLLAAHDADGLSMACFSMIQHLDTTSCLALSMLNDAADTIGACEGDLDAAATLFLLKALGADFVWIANPIIYDATYLDLAHCTAPRCACRTALDYRLLRHHESGRGVAPEVALPSGEAVSLVRIGNDLRDVVVHAGTTERRPKMHTCHTQIRVHVASTDRILDTLLGTHLVMTYGDYRAEIGYAADLLGLRVL